MDDDVLSSRRALLYFSSNLNNELASPVSRRDAQNAELASLAKKCVKHSGPPRGHGDRTGGKTVHAENTPHPCALSLPTQVQFPSRPNKRDANTLRNHRSQNVLEVWTLSHTRYLHRIFL
jgi:hypothetical protein